MVLKEKFIETYISSCLEKNIFISSNKFIKSFFIECILEVLDDMNYLKLLSTYDDSLAVHSINTAILTVFLSVEQDLPKDIIKELVIGALFHDLGKLYLPKNILYKAGGLTEKEWAIIQTHPNIGYTLMKRYKPTQLVLDIIKYHHSGFNKSGYPKVEARRNMDWDLIQIVALADAFDAMSSKRSYREQMPLTLIHKEIETNLGKQFDPISGHYLLSAIDNFMCPEKGKMLL